MPMPGTARGRVRLKVAALWWSMGKGTMGVPEMPFLLISQEFLIFTNLNCQYNLQFRSKIGKFSKLLLFQE